MKVVTTVAIILAYPTSSLAWSNAWINKSMTGTSSRHILYARSERRNFIKQTTATGLAYFGLRSESANALVKGNAPPPPKKKVSDDDKPKCRNIEECQEMAEKAAIAEEAIEKANAEPAMIASKGTRYRDVELGTAGATAKPGSDVSVYFKVLKLGKRSYDGLSGEGTVVFSRGPFLFILSFLPSPFQTFCKITSFL